MTRVYLSVILIIIALAGHDAFLLRCYECSFNRDSRQSHFFDRVEASPSLCDKVDFCAGIWCTQQLDGDKVTLGCSNAPLSAFTIEETALWGMPPSGRIGSDEKGIHYPGRIGDVGNSKTTPEIHVQCNAVYDATNNVATARCHCRNGDLCNRAAASIIQASYIVCLLIVSITQHYFHF